MLVRCSQNGGHIRLGFREVHPEFSSGHLVGPNTHYLCLRSPKEFWNRKRVKGGLFIIKITPSISCHLINTKIYFFGLCTFMLVESILLDSFTESLGDRKWFLYFLKIFSFWELVYCYGDSPYLTKHSITKEKEKVTFLTLSTTDFWLHKTSPKM